LINIIKLIITRFIYNISGISFNNKGVNTGIIIYKNYLLSSPVY